MTYIVEFFKAIGDIISSIVEFIVDLVTGLIDFFLLVPDYVDMITELISQLPPVVVGFSSATMAAALIFIVIGRRGT